LGTPTSRSIQSRHYITGLPNYLFCKSYRLFGFFLPLDLGSHFNLKGVCRRFDKDYFEPFGDLFWNYLRLPVRHDLPWEQLPSSYSAGRLRMQDGELLMIVWHLFNHGDRDMEREQKLLLLKYKPLSSSHLSENQLQDGL
jgi:hypothetical protein